jgi:hypothetical protein
MTVILPVSTYDASSSISGEIGGPGGTGVLSQREYVVYDGEA